MLLCVCLTRVLAFRIALCSEYFVDIFHLLAAFTFFIMGWLTLTSSLLVLIKHARHKAVIQHEYVVMCGSIDMQHCDGHWGRGILVLTHHRIYYRFKIPEHKVNLASLWGDHDKLNLIGLVFKRVPGTLFVT